MTMRLAPVVAVVTALGLALVLSPYRLSLLALVAIYGIAALAQNLLSGYGDVPSLGNVAFFATGAYVAGSLIALAHLAAGPAMALGVVAAGTLGLIVGVPALRISGMHLAIVTVALVFVAQELMGQWDQAHSPGGVSVGTPNWLLDERGLYIAALVMVVVVYVAVWNVLCTRSGRALLALSENPLAAAAVGINVTRYRLIAFVLSGSVTGVAGVTYLYYAHTVTPAGFPLDLSLAFLTMMILGGTRSLGGSLLGAAIIGLLPQALGVLPSHIGPLDVSSTIYAVYAVLLLLTLRFFPEGIWNSVGGKLRLSP